MTEQPVFIITVLICATIYSVMYISMFFSFARIINIYLLFIFQRFEQYSGLFTAAAWIESLYFMSESLRMHSLIESTYLLLFLKGTVSGDFPATVFLSLFYPSWPHYSRGERSLNFLRICRDIRSCMSRIELGLTQLDST